MPSATLATAPPGAARRAAARQGRSGSPRTSRTAPHRAARAEARRTTWRMEGPGRLLPERIEGRALMFRLYGVAALAGMCLVPGGPTCTEPPEGPRFQPPRFVK